MMNVSKYKRQYYLPPETCMDWAKKDYIDKAPAWCSVDLRDGNQALCNPNEPWSRRLNSSSCLYRSDLRRSKLVSRQHLRQSIPSFVL